MKRHRDYREMLAQQKDIDAVIIATPDHMHAPIASAAMAAGKHVYVQKPMCWSVHEARHLAAQAAANPKLVTQMGNQGHSTDEARRGQDYLASGVDRRHHGRARVDQPAARVLAAGRAAAEEVQRRLEDARLEQQRRHRAPRERVHEQGEGERAEGAALGSVPRRRA